MTRNKKLTIVYESLSSSSDNDREEEKKEEFRGYSEMIGSEEENNSKTQDILKSNQTLKESDRLFTTMQGLGMSIKNMSKMKELGMSESTIKRKRRQLRTEGYLSRKEGSGRNRLIDEEKSYFILDLMKKNAFLSAPKIVKQLVDNYKDFNISATTVQRFLNEQGFKWKEPIARVKNKLLQRNQRLAFCNKNIDRDWSSVVFTDESSFYLHIPGISRWVPKGESNIIVKENTKKKCMYGEHIEAREQSV